MDHVQSPDSTTTTFPEAACYGIGMERMRTGRFPPISLPGGGSAELGRCDDHFFRKELARSMPIELRGSRLVTLTGRLGLPEIYAALTALTGPSGDLYDDWKGAFSFPFELTVRRDDREARYLLHLTNYRSMVEPTLYRVQNPGESYKQNAYHTPFDEELSTDDIVAVTDFVLGFLMGYLETMPRWTTPFVKKVPSNLILFGYDPEAGAFFERAYSEEEAYRAAFDHWRAILPKSDDEKS